MTARMIGTVFLGLVVLMAAMPSRAAGGKEDILFQKQDLEEILKEVEQSRRKLDSLKQAEKDVLKTVSEYDQKIASGKKVLSRLNRKLKKLKKQIAETEKMLADFQELYERTRRRYLGNLRQFYFAARQTELAFAEQVNEELELKREVIYLAALAQFESGNVAQAREYLEESRQKLTELSGAKKKVAGLKKKKETATALNRTRKEKEQKKLERLRRKKSAEADRILTLQQAAQEIERIIARLQREKEATLPTASRDTSVPSAFAALRGQLLSPFKGKIVVGFGNHVDPVTKLKSFSPGITIKGKSGRKVVAVADGTVVYVGNLRGYGNFIIINHDDRYFSTYGGLGKTAVKTSEYVVAGTTLAYAGSDGLVKFELRKGRTPLDPVKWIRLDSF